MRIIRISSKDEVYSYWLKSEWWSKIRTHYPLDFQSKAQGMVDNPNLDDSAENRCRENILYGYRSGILRQLPSDTMWQLAEIDNQDLPFIYIIPAEDWFEDTGRTFKLLDTKVSLRTDGSHFDQVSKVIDHLREKRLDHEKLILIGSESTYTIIDGTHRASALVRSDSPLPWKAFLGKSPNMNNCCWHIESDMAKKQIRKIP